MSQNDIGRGQNPPVKLEPAAGQVKPDQGASGNQVAGPTDTTLAQAWSAFAENMIATNNYVKRIDSPEPAVFWPLGGELHTVTIFEYSGPNSMGDQSPPLFRVRVNMCAFQEEICQQLMADSTSPLAFAPGPILQLTALPYEVGQLGQWVMRWLTGHVAGRKVPPKPPVELIAWGWDENGADQRPCFTSLKSKWRDHDWLWTAGAIEVFEPWLKAG